MKIEEVSIETIGQLQFSVEEAAIILGVDAKKITEDKKMTRDYLRGRLTAQMAIRQKLFNLAIGGELQAQKLFHELSRKSEPEFEAE